VMDNAIYYHVAYVVAAVVLGAYAASIWWRGRDLARREAAARRSAPEPR
jgi:hypothetical protein